ncbi:hypothetical protein FKN01_15505 [Streptomyces sp. 130]|uniref:hypothetical protein n=1 Tax=Streptomyces sp. 130 TaxID=2591006 RepID=UPI0011809247|nr:hypothetical protein [Streptomyces sp. 130]TRV77501.1 hypothetical protein FKN01_15505 [Streptomyces sp. 130]
MDAPDIELDKELKATLQARGELGADYDSALAESFLEKVEQRLDATLERRVRRHLAEERTAVARGMRSPERPYGHFGERYGFGIISLVLAIPLSAIGVAQAGIGGLVVAWLGIVGVNAFQAGHGRRLFRGGEERRTASGWED